MQSVAWVAVLAVSVTAMGEEMADGGAPVDAGASAPALEPLSAPDAGSWKDPVELSAELGEGATLKVGQFKLNVRGRIQVQGSMLFPGDDVPVTERRNQIIIRRARLVVRGDALKNLSFYFQLAFAPSDMELDAPSVLRDAYLTWSGLRDANLRVGQMKVPFDVQRVVSSSSLQMVDRSIVTGELNLDRDVGIQVFSEDVAGLGKRLRYYAGVFGGDGRNRFAPNTGLLYVARVRVSPFGDLDDKVEGDIHREQAFRLAVGGAFARNVDTVRQRSTIGSLYRLGGFTYDSATVDLHLKWRGFSFLTEGFYRKANLDSRSGHAGGADLTEYSRSAWGYFAQAGYYPTQWLEVTARYGEIYPMAGTDPTFTRQREIGVGVGGFLKHHDAKVQADYFYLDDGRGHSVRYQLRLQVQLYF